MLKFFRIPFAQSGDRAPVPDPADVNGLVSYEQGYGFDYQRQKTDPASKNIERDKMNEIFFDMTTAVAELQAAGVPDFITSALNGGTPYSYSRFAVVRYDDGSAIRLYQSTADANTTLPTDSTKWVLVPMQANAANIASAASIDIRGIFGNYAHVTGTTGITSIVMREGQEVTLVFDGVVTITNGASLILPGGTNLTTSVGLSLTLRGEASGVTRAISGAPASTPNQIQPLPTPTLAGNALTMPSATYALDFRKTPLSTGGAPTSITGTPAAMTLPPGATLGGISGVAQDIVWLLLNNAGTMEYAAVNLAGGNDLTETGLISTTAITSGATAENVIYSNTARTNVPYRVIGKTVSTQATAGTWVTPPTLVQGVGGQALAALSSLGYGQTWQDVTGSRVDGVTYYNTTGRPIAVNISGVANSAIHTRSLSVNGTLVAQMYMALGYSSTWVSGIVPPGGSYVASIPYGDIIWAELR